MGYMDRLSRGIGYSSYNDYLKSEHWRKTRSKNVRRVCFCCGSRKRLHLHHLSYERLGKEIPTDFATLCDPCHRKVHVVVRDKKSRLSEAHIYLKKQQKPKKKKRKRKKRPKRYSKKPSQYSVEVSDFDRKLDEIANAY